MMFIFVAITGHKQISNFIFVFIIGTNIHAVLDGKNFASELNLKSPTDPEILKKLNFLKRLQSQKG